MSCLIQSPPNEIGILIQKRVELYEITTKYHSIKDEYYKFRIEVVEDAQVKLLVGCQHRM